MPVVTKLGYRKPTRVATTKQEGPRPISMVGEGRASSIQSFTEGQAK